MRVVTWTIRLVLFLLLAAFAAKNADPVTLRFYFDLAFTAPLVVLLLGFFVAGALFGMLALLGTVLRQRRDMAALKRQAAAAPPAPPPPPPL
jgi:uncharacterized integral membrane protein